jgi:hypothetical protein
VIRQKHLIASRVVHQSTGGFDLLPKLLSKLTYANVVSTVCLFVLLGGSAYAATKITGKQIKDSSITGKDIRNSSLTGKDVKNKSLTSSDVKGAVTVHQISRVVASKTIGPGGVDSVTVACPPGQGVISGGFTSTGADTEVFFSDSFGSPNTWAVALDNFDSSLSGNVTAVAYCAPSGQAVAPSAAATSRARARAQAAVARQRASH